MAVENCLFLVWIEINSVFVSGNPNRLVLRVGIEFDLISVMGSKLAWFCVGLIDFVIVWVSKLTFLCGRSKLILLCLGR